MDEIKKCPHCGGEAIKSITQNLARCKNNTCVGSVWQTVDSWNTRPIEAALEAEIKRLMAVLLQIDKELFPFPSEYDSPAVLAAAYEMAHDAYYATNDPPALLSPL